MATSCRRDESNVRVVDYAFGSNTNRHCCREVLLLRRDLAIALIGPLVHASPLVSPANRWKPKKCVVVLFASTIDRRRGSQNYSTWQIFPPFRTTFLPAISHFPPMLIIFFILPHPRPRPRPRPRPHHHDHEGWDGKCHGSSRLTTP